MSPPDSEPRSPPELPGRFSPPHRERRALKAGLLASAAFHLVLIALYPLLYGEGLPVPPSEEPSPTPVLDGTEVIQLVELPGDEIAPPTPPEAPAEEPLPAEAPEPEAPAETVEAPAPGDAEEDGEPLKMVERLRPRLVDPRLWAPLGRRYVALDDRERAQLMLADMIRTWNDSVAVAMALSEEALDWTYTDDDGQRWGLSPGRLHLGTFSIPLPALGLASWQRQDAFSDDNLVFQDLRRGAAAAQVRETWTDRARAIRERLEAERGRTAPEAPSAEADDGRGGSP